MAGKTFLAFPVQAQPAILRICCEAHPSNFNLFLNLHDYGRSRIIYQRVSASKMYLHCFLALTHRYVARRIPITCSVIWSVIFTMDHFHFQLLGKPRSCISNYTHIMHMDVNVITHPFLSKELDNFAVKFCHESLCLCISHITQTMIKSYNIVCLQVITNNVMLILFHYWCD